MVAPSDAPEALRKWAKMERSGIRYFSQRSACASNADRREREMSASGGKAGG